MKRARKALFLPTLGWLLLSSHLALAKEPAPAPGTDLIQQVSKDFGPSWVDGNASQTAGPKTEENLNVSEEAVMPPLWIPMCFMYDRSVNTLSVNQQLKGLAAAYASCGIAIEPLTFTIKSNYPNDFVAVKKAALAACPLNSVFHVRGSIQIEARSTEIAGQMCGDPGAKGCSTLCEPVSLSFVAPNSGTVSALHESMHGNCCGSACVNKGEGGGKVAGPGLEIASFVPEHFPRSEVFQAEKDTAGAEAKISPEGCQALRAGASPNDLTHWFDPLKRVYYVPEDDPALQKDLMSGKNFIDETRFASRTSESADTEAASQSLLGSIAIKKELATDVTVKEPPPDKVSNRKSPSFAKREIARSNEGPYASTKEDSERKKRGSSLRRQKSSIEEINVYGGAGGSEGEDSSGE